ncbi:MAG TPA: DUF885 domain-containing protein, partial [Cellulomonas sp.]|nr:DUF885 domain-containing protein [Cellulomonas sp.]
MTTTRQPTAIDQVAEDHITIYAGLDPLQATTMGIAGHDHEMTDLSPAGHEARTEAARATLSQLDGLSPIDETDEI